MTSNQCGGGLCFARWEYAGSIVILAQTDGALHSRTMENRIATANIANMRRGLSISLIIPLDEIKIPTCPKLGEKWGRCC